MKLAQLYRSVVSIACVSLAACGLQNADRGMRVRLHRVVDVVIQNPADGVSLAGTLTLPASPGKYPAVLLIPGTGPRNRDAEIVGHRPFLILAEHLSRHGLVVLRVDKRGCGESGGEFIPFDVDQAVDDARAEIHFLRSYPEVDPRRVGLIGHSEGAFVGSILASQSDRVEFLVLLAGPGILGRDFFCLRWAARAKASGQSDDVCARITDRCQRMPPVWTKDHLTPDEEAEAKRAVEEYLRYVDPDPFTPDSFLAAVRTRMFRNLINRDPQEILQRVSCPVLAMAGDKDVHVPSRPNLSAIREALEAGDNKRHRVVELTGLNHLFQACTSGLPSEWAEISECMSPPTLDTITDWLEDLQIIERLDDEADTLESPTDAG